ncbi:MAG: peptide deformylase [Anaerolineae bacterium]|nr:peptide deformylase [Anaerolineae bacterium]
MALRQIRFVGDPVLRKRAHKVNRFDADLATLVQDMAETMRHSNGVGLAAPQVGITARVIVVETPQDEDEPGSGRLYAVINSEVARASKEMLDGLEGCLSIPGYVGEVTRHAAVTVKGQDLEGRKVRIKAQGFVARVFQHEIDHLHGVLYIDKLTAPDRLWRVEGGEEEEAEVQNDTSELAAAGRPLEWVPM